MWRGLRLLLVSILCVAISGFKTSKNIQKYRCDYSRVMDGEGWLKFHVIPSNWNEARLRCHMEGAVLASPLTEGLRNAMTAAMTSKKVSQSVFTGVHAIFSRSDFASIEGTPLADIPLTWAEGQPNNLENKESCLILLPDGTMTVANCKDSFPYFCYKKYTPSSVFTSCGTTDPHYSFDYRTGSCYKFHNVPRTWSRAYMNCMAEGAYLAIINSETEATVLKELFAEYPPESILWIPDENASKENAFVGIHDWNEHGDWRTIQGQTLQEAGFAKFTEGTPNNLKQGLFARTRQFCGGIYRDGLFNDLWCEDLLAFICEKDPASLVCDDDNYSV